MHYIDAVMIYTKLATNYLHRRLHLRQAAHILCIIHHYGINSNKRLRVSISIFPRMSWTNIILTNIFIVY